MRRNSGVRLLLGVMLGASLFASSEAHATRTRVSILDAIGVGGAAVFGPAYRKRTWSGTPYQVYQPRFYGYYPLNRNLVREPTWGSRR
ncbi:MAG: hypothetical protein WC807_04535 [Hyphomicrobium sp.]|jgi:hypothetical protein